MVVKAFQRLLLGSDNDFEGRMLGLKSVWLMELCAESWRACSGF